MSGGRVRGVRESTTLAWKGIPYAAPPVGPLRFRAPQPVVAWRGVRDCSRFGDIAQQSIRRLLPLADPIPMSEDCLSVNVRTPAGHATASSRLPVMVFIHGGGYSTGSSRDFSGQGEGFAGSGRVVYVSFNYRLGPFGYLDFRRYSTRAHRFDGNLGLRDQAAALRWVRANIRAFGGDPRRVTVFGESAGGNAITTLMATPSARGLFARAIAQSPPPNAVYEATTTGAWAAEFVESLRTIRPSDVDDATLLAHARAADLLEAAETLQIRTPDRYPGEFCFAPVVDGGFLPVHPLVAFRSGYTRKIPVIIGTNAREGSIFRGRIDILPRSPRRIAALFDRAPAQARDPMRAAYPGLPAPRAAADFGGDYGFWYPSIRFADLQARRGPVFAYRFDVAPRLLKIVGLDATHGVEMFALFDRLEEPLARAMTSLGGAEAYAAAGGRMRERWLRFAESGEPGSDWPAYDEGERLTLVIDEADRIESDPHRERRMAWEAFLPSLGG
ncbi:carboxylesterase/lipase family protein [Rathayibacter sp. YIM 133350]